MTCYICAKTNCIGECEPANQVDDINVVDMPAQRETQRKPLTDEQVTDGCRTLGVGAYRTLAAAFEAGVRFAEAAHGIKEQP